MPTGKPGDDGRMVTERACTSLLAVLAAVLLACCQSSAQVGEPNQAPLAELYGSGRLQLTAGTSNAFVTFWNDGRPGLFAATVNSGAHAFQYCMTGVCSADQARRVIDECNSSIRVMRRTCALLVSGSDIVWRGEVLDPYRRHAVLAAHNQQFAQAMVFDLPGAREQAAATVFIDDVLPVGQFTLTSIRLGGFCQGVYDFSSPANRTWEIRCLSGYEVMGTLQADDLARGGSGLGTDSDGGEVGLILTPRG